MRQRDIACSADKKANPEKYKRTGVPDGMTRKKAEKLWAKAHKLADRFIQIMKDKGELPVDDFDVVEVDVLDDDGVITGSASVKVPTTDAGKAEAALREVFVLAVGPSTQQIKIQACNSVLAYTKSKPESKSKLTLNKAEDFLDEIMKDDGAASTN